MSDIRVISCDTLVFKTAQYRCAIGRSGFETGERKEGSGTTPQGRFALRECWYRADRIKAPATLLPMRVIKPDDGWCDAPEHACYNRHVKLPFAASHEKLWRDDHMYDIIVPLGYNDAPVVAGKGSAIFLHIAGPDYSTTEGCVAVNMQDMLVLLEAMPAMPFIFI